MLPSPYGCRLGPRGYSLSRPQRVHFCYGPVTRGLPWGDLVDRFQSFSFHHLCYPNYRALTFTPAGLSPAEHASLRWTHNRTCSFPAYGSHLGCLTAALGLPYALRPGDTLSRHCVRHVRNRFAFSLASALRSTASAAGRPVLFGGFVATMAESDFSCPCIIGFGSSPSRCGPVGSQPVAGHETSQVPTRSFRT